MFNVVLVEPLIPQNTGSIARLTAATGCLLHLIEPLGFELSDRYLKRAGLDYWTEVKLEVHKSWEAFVDDTGCKANNSWFFTTKASRIYYSANYIKCDFLVFGNESKGLPEYIHSIFHDRRLKIPIDNDKVRSINLSNAVSIALYEARRQTAL